MTADSTLTAAYQADLLASIAAHQALFEPLRGRRLLLTGASGMLPGVLADTLYLLNRHYGFNTRYCCIIGRNRQRLLHLGDDPLAEVRSLNLAEPFELEGEFDYIIHAASLASPGAYLRQPLDTIHLNVFVTRQLLELAVKQSATRLLFFGSGEIYGSPDADHTPTPEDFLPPVDHLTNRSCYVESKRFGETLCLHYSRQHQQPVAVIRPIHIFGPGLRLDDGRVIADFVRNAINQEPIIIKSDGLATRAFCYLTDANIMMWNVLLRDSSETFDVFNIGNPANEVSIRELAQLFSELYGCDLQLLGTPAEEGKEAPLRSSPDIGKFIRSFGFEPQVSLSEGVQKAVEWAREYQIGRAHV